jgi:hypothetical protein
LAIVGHFRGPFLGQKLIKFRPNSTFSVLFLVKANIKFRRKSRRNDEGKRGPKIQAKEGPNSRQKRT